MLFMFHDCSFICTEILKGYNQLSNDRLYFLGGLLLLGHIQPSMYWDLMGPQSVSCLPTLDSNNVIKSLSWGLKSL